MTEPRSKEEIIEYIRTNLEGAARGTAAALARRLGKTYGSIISEILAGKRNVSAPEFAIIKEFFDELHGRAAAPGGELREARIAGGVPVVGRIGENVWTKTSLSPVLDKETLMVGAVIVDYPVSEQQAYTLEETPAGSDYRKGDLIFTVPYQLYRTRPLVDDDLVVKTEEDGFERFTLRRVVDSDVGAVVVPFSPDRKLAKMPGATETIVGLVIGYFRPKKTVGTPGGR